MQTEWEFERKFVVSYVPEGLLDTRRSVVIRQGYLATERDKHIRIRDEGGHYTMTVKQGMGLKRRDTSLELNAAQFNDLWPFVLSFCGRGWFEPVEESGEIEGKAPAAAPNQKSHDEEEMSQSSDSMEEDEDATQFHLEGAPLAFL